MKSPEYYRDQVFQEIIFRQNQPHMRSGTQSAFTNFSIFDRPYFEALFGGKTFPDGSPMIDAMEEFIEYQKAFMRIVSRIRSENVFTFPVLSYSLLRKDGRFVDEEFTRWCSKHNMKWGDSNFFVSDDVTSLSNCCFDGSQMILTKSSDGIKYDTIKNTISGPYKNYRTNLTVFHNGSWCKAKCVTLPKRDLYKVTTSNNKEIIVTDNHINPTLDGNKQTVDLSTEDYLLFNTMPLDSFKERDNHLTYEQGFIIGAYAGDGSHNRGPKRDNKRNTITLSLNEGNTKDILTLNKGLKDLGIDKEWSTTMQQNNVMDTKVTSEILYDFIFSYLSGGYSYDKEFNLTCLYESREFRQGIIDGWMATDGGNSNRIYSVSKKLIETGEIIMTSLGMNSVINCDSSRVGVVAFADGAKHNYPLYCIRYYGEGNRRSFKNVFIKRNNNMYFKIKSIEPYETEESSVYCFEMENKDEPYFTLPNGIITHNCRLVSDIKNTLYFNSIGATALEVGSIKVNTINLAKISYQSETQEEYLETLKERTLLCLQALDVVRHIIKRNVEKGLLPNFTKGLINFDTCYNTVGILGIEEAVDKFGLIEEDEFGYKTYTDEGLEFAKNILGTIREVQDEFAKDKDYSVNLEQVPAERAAAILMQKDKFFYPNEKYELPLYGNQWVPLGVKATLQERVRVSAVLDKACSGGSILHASLDAPLEDEEVAWKLLNYIADKGVTYFAFNLRISACAHNHGFYGNTCPTCGEPVATTYQRIVGFLTPVSTYSKERKEEFNMRQWMGKDDLI